MTSNKIAFVTGASRGIGKAIAITLAEMGYQLALVAKTKENLEQTAQAIIQLTNHTHQIEPLVFSLDVADEQKVNKAINQTIKTLGGIDVLVNGAGILIPGSFDLSAKDFFAMIEANLLGAFYCIQATIPHMKKKKSGYIFNIASRAGKVGVGHFAGYSASKFGLVGLNQAFSSELAQFNIKMTAICPGWVDTDMSSNAMLTAEEKISPKDIADTVRFLLSLSPNCYIKECVLECRKNLEMANTSPLKKNSQHFAE